MQIEDHYQATLSRTSGGAVSCNGHMPEATGENLLEPFHYFVSLNVALSGKRHVLVGLSVVFKILKSRARTVR